MARWRPLKARTSKLLTPEATLLIGLLLVLGVVRVFDGQTPDVEVITNRDDHVGDETAVNTNSKTEAHEYKGDLVCAVSQCRWPAQSKVLFQHWSKAVNDAEEEGRDEDVGPGELGFRQVSCDHFTDRVCVDEASIEDEGDEMLVEDDGLEVQVGGDEDPGREERDKTVEGGHWRLVLQTALSQYVEDAADTLVRLL